MKKIILIAFICCCFFSCQTADKAYIESNYEYLELSTPDMVKYITADNELSDVEKEARIKAANEALELSREAVNQHGK